MRNWLKFLLVIAVSFLVNSCVVRTRFACADEEQMIEELQAKLTASNINNDELRVLISAKDRTISAQTTIISAMDNGQKCLEAFQDQMVKLAGDLARMENNKNRIDKRLAECQDSWKLIEKDGDE